MMRGTASEVETQRRPDAIRAKQRQTAHGSTPAVLADVFQEDVNMATWHRELTHEAKDAVGRLVTSDRSLKTAMTLSPDKALACISDALGSGKCALSRDIAELVEMFCYLLGRRRAGLRLAVLDAAMCPKFHVDMVPCRLVTTYLGPGTEWLPHGLVNRSKLGIGGRGQSDLESGLIKGPGDIQRLSPGDVAVLKGELWEGNEDAGLVHRSPAVPSGDVRLILTLDVSG